MFYHLWWVTIHDFIFSIFVDMPFSSIKLLCNNTQDVLLQTSLTLIKLGQNILSHPTESKYRRVELNIDENSLITVDGGVEALFDMGFIEVIALETHLSDPSWFLENCFLGIHTETLHSNCVHYAIDSWVQFIFLTGNHCPPKASIYITIIHLWDIIIKVHCSVEDHNFS